MTTPNSLGPFLKAILPRLSVPLFLFALFLLLIPIAYFASRNHAAWPGIIILWPLGTTLGIGMLIAGRSAAGDAEKMMRAVAGAGQDIPGDGEVATIVGTIRAFGETLRSSFSHIDSVFYYYQAGHLEQTRNLAKRRPSDLDYETVLMPDYEGYGVVPAHVHSSIGDFKLLRIPTHFNGFSLLQSTSAAMPEEWSRFLSETTFAQDTYRFGLLGARIASGNRVDAVVREDVRYDRPGQQVFQIEETVVPAGARVIAKGKYSAEEKGLTGTISLTAVSDVTMRQLKNTKRGLMVLGVLIILGATGLSWLLTLFG